MNIETLRSRISGDPGASSLCRRLAARSGGRSPVTARSTPWRRSSSRSPSGWRRTSRRRPRSATPCASVQSALEPWEARHMYLNFSDERRTSPPLPVRRLPPAGRRESAMGRRRALPFEPSDPRPRRSSRVDRVGRSFAARRVGPHVRFARRGSQPLGEGCDSRPSPATLGGWGSGSVAIVVALLALPSTAAAGARDVQVADGAVYRAGLTGRYFHPLGSFGKLNRAVTAGDRRRSRRLATLPDRPRTPPGPLRSRLVLQRAGRAERLDVGPRPGGRGTGARARRKKGGGAARIPRDPRSAPDPAAAGTLDQALRLQQRRRAERPAPGGALDRPLRAPDERHARAPARAAASADGEGAPAALRQRLVVALLARRALRHARVPRVRDRAPLEALGAAARRPVARLREPLLEVPPAPARPAARRPPARGAAGHGRLPRLRADHVLALEAVDRDVPDRGHAHLAVVRARLADLPVVAVRRAGPGAIRSGRRRPTGAGTARCSGSRGLASTRTAARRPSGSRSKGRSSRWRASDAQSPWFEVRLERMVAGEAAEARARPVRASRRRPASGRRRAGWARRPSSSPTAPGTSRGSRSAPSLARLARAEAA